MSAPAERRGVDVSWMTGQQVRLVLWLDSVRGRMLIEGSENASDDEIERCLRNCVCDVSGVARMARDLGLPISGDGARLAIESNFARNIRARGVGVHDDVAADAMDAISAALDECRVRGRNPSIGKDAVATRYESAQTMAHGSSADGVSVQLPLALARVGGAK